MQGCLLHLVGLVNGNVLPLPLAVDIFDVMVDAFLCASRWLWLGSETALRLLDEFLDSCARSLLGAVPWRNAAVLRSELGWILTAGSRLVRDVACRHARLQCLEQGDLYKEVSDAALGVSGAGIQDVQSLFIKLA